MNQTIQILLLTGLAGVVGMGLGGLVSAAIGNTPKLMSWMLSFAGGVMIAIVTFELVPEGIELAGYWITIAGLLAGVLLVLVLHRVIDKITLKNGDDIQLHMEKEGLYHEKKLVNNPSLLRSGIVMLVAISLHNLPEGIAIGAASIHDYQLSIMLAVIIMLHCIPEGMAVASPLIGGGVKRKRAVFLTALSGLPTIIGGLIGMWFGGISNATLALAFAGAGGAMLYVVFAEMLPQSTLLSKSRWTGMAGLLGILAGLGMTALH